MTPFLRAEAGHACDLSHGNQRNVLTLPRLQGAVDSGYSPDAHLFSSPEVTYMTLRWALRRLLRHRIRKKGAGGGGGGLVAHRGGGGAWAWERVPGKPLSPIPEPIGAGDFAQAKVFTGPRGALMRGSHWEFCFLHWEERVSVKLQRSGRKTECIRQWASNLGGVYDPGQEASYEGTVQGLTITRTIKPLAQHIGSVRTCEVEPVEDAPRHGIGEANGSDLHPLPQPEPRPVLQRTDLRIHHCQTGSNRGEVQGHNPRLRG